MTKKQAYHAQRAAWAAAVNDHRVVRHELGNLTSYPTHEARDAAIAAAHAAGLTAEVVEPPAANP